MRPPGAHGVSSVRSRSSYLIDDILELTVNSSLDDRKNNAETLYQENRRITGVVSTSQQDNLDYQMKASDLSRPKYVSVEVDLDEDESNSNIDVDFQDNHDERDDLSDIIDVIHD